MPLTELRATTRIMLEHLSGGVSMKRRRKRIEVVGSGGKEGGGKYRRWRKGDRRRKKRCSPGNQTQDLPCGRSKL